MTDEKYPDMYRLGREARELGYGKESCNIRSLSEKRSWWLAGWHDMDMELSNEQTSKLAQQVKDL